MPRGGPRGAMRGGAPRGGLGRGSAPRGAPSGRGGPVSASNRGGAAPRSRPPTAGAPRMLPTPSMSHQQGPAASQPKVEGYEDYVSSPASRLVWDGLRFRGCGVVFFVPTAAVLVDRIHFLSVLWRVLSRDWLWGIWELLHSAACSRVSFCVCVCFSLFACPNMALKATFSPAGIQNIMITVTERPRKRLMKVTVSDLSRFFPSSVSNLLTAPLAFLFLVPAAQDEWDNSWSSAGAGGKAAPARQTKGGYRDHPYGRYWSSAGRALPRQLCQIVTLWTFQKVISLLFAPFFLKMFF